VDVPHPERDREPHERLDIVQVPLQQRHREARVQTGSNGHQHTIADAIECAVASNRVVRIGRCAVQTDLDA
jgi:hypothetical protein